MKLKLGGSMGWLLAILLILILCIYIKYFLQHQLLQILEKFNQFNVQQYSNINTVQSSLSNNLTNQTEHLTKQLLNISQLLENKFNSSLEKNATTFTEIMNRLSLIDNAQKNIMEASNNLLSLQNILADKKSRGAFGEIQLKNLIENMLTKENFQLQYTLSNGYRCDCMLFLPQPTGNIAIDAKFPLESFQKSIDLNRSMLEREKYIQLFKQNIKKHIEEISTKYIIPNETANGAIMFIPAESVFAEIHNNYLELVELAYKKRIWIASPTTIMAILTTASAVIQDHATKKNIGLIQQHLRALAEDFSRFDERIDKLLKHLELTIENAQAIKTSSKKINQKFNKIEKVDLIELEL